MAYWNKDIETMPAKDLEALQYQLLKNLIRRVYDSSPFYHDKKKAAGVLPEDLQSLADIRKLPFMKKQDLRDGYPDKTFAVPLSRFVRNDW